ncbi:hypothetical protein ABZ348_06240 [Streptomyces sp. NPDC005963]|uniref:hypothetical protein n=1 Tax=Streptomyces sp. NPDC005963 TaxID=3156721 RepID=UPI00340F211F
MTDLSEVLEELIKEPGDRQAVLTAGEARAVVVLLGLLAQAGTDEGGVAAELRDRIAQRIM